MADITATSSGAAAHADHHAGEGGSNCDAAATMRVSRIIVTPIRVATLNDSGASALLRTVTVS